MPLIVPTIDKITDLKSLIGKKLVDESNASYISAAASKGDSNAYDISQIVYHAQLPDNALILKQDVDHTAITGAFKEGMTPVIVDAEDIIVKIY